MTIKKFRAWDKGAMSGPMGLLLNDSPVWLSNLTSEAILMQFTGLHDKNGKEIYESDWIIMDLWNGGDGYTEPSEHDVFEGIVTWHEGGFGINTKPFRDTPEINLMSQSTYVDIEIIGNIYENPELLEEK